MKRIGPRNTRRAHDPLEFIRKVKAGAPYVTPRSENGRFVLCCVCEFPLRQCPRVRPNIYCLGGTCSNSRRINKRARQKRGATHRDSPTSVLAEMNWADAAFSFWAQLGHQAHGYPPYFNCRRWGAKRRLPRKAPHARRKRRWRFCGSYRDLCTLRIYRART